MRRVKNLLTLIFVSILLVCCNNQPEKARKKLQEANVEFSEEVFLRKCEEGVVNLFVTAEMNPNVTHNSGKTALMLASEGGHTAVVKILLDAGANVDVVTEQTVSPFDYYMMLPEGAELGEKRESITALLFAAFNGHSEIVRLLLKSGANPDVMDGWGHSALFWTSRSGRVEIVEALLEAGADPNLESRLGTTPLMQASLEGHLEIIRKLISAGADCDKANPHSGKTAWDLAKNRDVIRLLEEACS